VIGSFQECVCDISAGFVPEIFLDNANRVKVFVPSPPMEFKGVHVVEHRALLTSHCGLFSLPL
jgi:hypothetical protein